jgi:hypothetical protein
VIPGPRHGDQAEDRCRRTCPGIRRTRPRAPGRREHAAPGGRGQRTGPRPACSRPAAAARPGSPPPPPPGRHRRSPVSWPPRRRAVLARRPSPARGPPGAPLPVPARHRDQPGLSCFGRVLDQVEGMPDSPPCPPIAAGSGWPGGRVKGRGSARVSDARRGALDAAARAMPMIRLRGGGLACLHAEEGRLPPGAAGGLAVCSGSGGSRAEWQEGGGSQPYLGARTRRPSGSGHMMMDWVSPRLRGDAAAHSFEAVRGLPCTAGHGRSDRGLPGAGRGGAPSDDEGALAHPIPRHR